jgi:flavin-dependent dehydrogenase
MPKALIIGNGIAGLSCARLLANIGWEIEVWGKHKLFSPTLILNQITCNLLQDIWQLDRSFWDSLQHLHERRVCWGTDGAVFRMTESSAVIEGNLLSDLLLTHLYKYDIQVQFQELSLVIDNLELLKTEFAWIIDAGGRQSAIAQQLGSGHRYVFGDRCLISQEVEIADSTLNDIYWIETVTGGWLFLAPLSKNKAVLQAMVPLISGQPSDQLAILLKKSRYIRSHIVQLLGSIVIFAAYPQILKPLSGDQYLAVGDAAFSVDPVSGDGTGYALRGAILATSVIDAIASGMSSGEALKHYSMRLEKAFDTHLQHCLEYYLNGFTNTLWQGENEKMQKVRQLWNPSRNENFTHTLTGFKLLKINK